MFNRIYSWVADAAAGIDITASRMDTDTTDITSNGFANCLTRDGQGSATANQPMNGLRHTNVGLGQSRTDYATLGQFQDGSGINWTVAPGSADAITATYSPALTALVSGQLCFVRVPVGSGPNTIAAPTFNPNGLGALTITKNGGAPLVAGDIPGGLCELILRYNIANTRWELLNPAQPNPQAVNPTGSVIAFAGSAAPAGYLICDGSSQLRAGALAALFAVIGTTYGSADGSHFNLPDLRGRVIASVDSGGSGRITVAGGNFDGTVLGGSGGGQNDILTQAQLPAFKPAITITDPTHVHAAPSGQFEVSSASTTSGGVGSGANLYAPGGANTASASTGITAALTANLGSGSTHPLVQPTIMMTYIIKT